MLVYVIFGLNNLEKVVEFYDVVMVEFGVK